MIDDREQVGFGNKLGDILTTTQLDAAVADNFKVTLQQAGYTVVNGANVTLEGNIKEFLVFGGGFSRGARISIRVGLKDKEGQILWQQDLKGSDGGMLNGVDTYGKSMNTALRRLLTQALDEFASDYFYQSVTKGNQKY